MTPEEIDRWKPEQIDEVFAACAHHEATCTTLSDSLNNPGVMENWGGTAADAARAAADRHRVDLDAHGAEVRGVKNAIDTARADVVDAKKSLADARADVASHQFVLDEATGTVSLNSTQQWMVSEVTVRSPERIAAESSLLAARDHSQQLVNAVMQSADGADRALAMAIQGATGEITLPDKPSGPEDVLPPTVGQLPGEPLTNSISVMGEPNSTITSRLVKVDVPEGFTDPKLSSDLAAKYAREVHFDPTTPGVVGKLSKDLINHSPNRFGGAGKDLPIPARPDTGDMDPRAPRTPSRPGTLDLSAEKVAQVRATSATPTSMHAVQVDGHNYLQIDYQYNYEGKQVGIGGVNGIKLPTTNADSWDRLTQDDVQFLAARGVDIPVPGR